MRSVLSRRKKVLLHTVRIEWVRLPRVRASGLLPVCGGFSSLLSVSEHSALMAGELFLYLHLIPLAVRWKHPKLSPNELLGRSSMTWCTLLTCAGRLQGVRFTIPHLLLQRGKLRHRATVRQKTLSERGKQIPLLILTAALWFMFYVVSVKLLKLLIEIIMVLLKGEMRKVSDRR